MSTKCVTSHVYYMSVMWECRGDTGGFSGEKAAKPVTVVQVCRSVFVSVKPLDIF